MILVPDNIMSDFTLSALALANVHPNGGWKVKKDHYKAKVPNPMEGESDYLIIEAMESKPTRDDNRTGEATWSASIEHDGDVIVAATATIQYQRSKPVSVETKTFGDLGKVYFLFDTLCGMHNAKGVNGYVNSVGITHREVMSGILNANMETDPDTAVWLKMKFEGTK
jgi:hypothetical protein